MEYKYVVYLDTKIKGAIIQLAGYFAAKIFPEDTVLVYKSYRSIHYAFKTFLEKKDIKYIAFRKYKDLPDLDNKVVFYLFNARSNCRLVADRKAKHIFITHGESNKVSSVKPIIRIYDHVAVSGQLGIDRYLHSGLFFNDDLARKKIIKMGDTFVGVAKYSYDKESSSILYSPTWEGGVADENYSSITEDIKSFLLLDKYAKKNNITKIVIQPHPNMGHRIKKHKIYFIKGVNFLIKKGYFVDVIASSSSLVFVMRLLAARKIKLSVFSKNIRKAVSMAFVDVSAMEIQLMSKKIPSFVFFTKETTMPKNKLLENHYAKFGIYNFTLKHDTNFIVDEDFINYCISYENEGLKNMSYCNRVNWLVKHIE